LADNLLIVSTDRISAFDIILPSGIPDKGRVLTELSVFWFKQTSHIIQNHLITSNVDEYPKYLNKYAKVLNGRSMLVRKAKPLPVECIVRGYITGLGWLEYKKNGSICGIKLPKGLLESEKLGSPIFTPTTKADMGSHDENISFELMCKKLGDELSEKIRKISIDVYSYAHDYALQKGIIIADTKYEYGIDKISDQLLLIDEILTPDSSRFWIRDKYEQGKTQNSYDKQFVRNYLNSINWDRKYPAPILPDDIIKKTTEKYKEVERILTR
jgi:phosphoribosylaminoimidazole-succinocarboxamide synthase